MKALISIILFLFVIIYTAYTQNIEIKGDNIESISCREKITTFLSCSYKAYETQFFLTGKYGTIDSIYACVLQGIRNDTIYNVLVVLEDCNVIDSFSIPVASFYKRNESIIKEYILGRIYIEHNKDNSCINVISEIFEPFKVDTLEYKFRYSMGKLLNKKQNEYCR